ncbi:hypothetical protein FOE78_15315 [Microlunatus elymi]|uniref:Uncharacterized protein n=1 Tax=Microlunatus elymi TaxID=2596828 RepID=A0A516Q0Z9_9ACTN|nr:hypothetical protein [Microlunatus elymi]QDP97113.1 hypothetical protein FOE78_15315 [Microlunatus elymi]
MTQRFNPPPGWPQPPKGWKPPHDWQPPSSWPPPPPGWQFWVKKREGRGKWIGIAAAVGIFALVIGVATHDRSGHQGAAATVVDSPTPSGHSARSNEARAATVGLIDPSTNGLTSDQLDQASAQAGWLMQREDLNFRYSGATELRTLAADYSELGVGGRKVPARLREAARLMAKGAKAADQRRYQTALNDYAKAAAKLNTVPALLRSDVRNSERSTGARMSPRPGAENAQYGDLFPVETKTREVTVKAWIDGDTEKSTKSGGGAYPGSTGPRCYAPGGKTWKPC